MGARKHSQHSFRHGLISPLARRVEDSVPGEKCSFLCPVFASNSYRKKKHGEKNGSVKKSLLESCHWSVGWDERGGGREGRKEGEAKR